MIVHRTEIAEGWFEDHTIMCPAHASEFDVRSGEAVHFPAMRPIRTYAVPVEGGRLIADISAVKTDLSSGSGQQSDEGLSDG